MPYQQKNNPKPATERAFLCHANCYNRVMATTVKIDSSSVKGLAERLKQAKERLQVGWFEGVNYDDGTPVAGVAAQNEFGGRNVPARPFMRPAIAEHSQKWSDIYRGAAKQWINGTGDYSSVLTAVGLTAEADIRNAIANGNHMPLSPVTLALRRLRNDNVPIGASTVRRVAAAIAAGQTGPGQLGQPFANADPLRETGYMIATLTHLVSE